MIVIDGSAGEGGGQVLRTALGLSLVTGQPFHIKNIRGKRKKPGLMRQHLTAVKAAAEIGRAEAIGAAIASQDLLFRPQSVQPGAYHFAIGTAGSCTLVLQAVLPALLQATGPSELVLEGGTHNPMAPPFDFLDKTFLPLLRQMGTRIDVELVRPGFFPAGGGKIKVRVKPAATLAPLELIERGTVDIEAKAVCAELPGHIALRELAVCRRKLDIPAAKTKVEQLDCHGPGNVVEIFVHSAHLTETFIGFGQLNVSAEKVASRTVAQVRTYLESEVPVGHHLADQLLVPLALAGKGRFRTSKPSQHTLTNIEVIELFLDKKIEMERVGDKGWEVRIVG
ncbi:MAG: RNA 3'-terminal phosphate cyclase [Thermodesulfobacteriota bacterium]